MAAILNIADFIDKFRQEALPVMDVRSEKEYLHGHFPGAVNLPLLNNDERSIIGTLYKQKGREEAVKKGFELVGPRFAGIIADAETLAPSRKVFLYCWRGGMRSNIIAWLLNMAGFQVFLLKGGYKSWRSWCLQQFEVPRKIIVVGGKTGSGKTEMLQALAWHGEQVIDLEFIACHKGSAFGSLGQKPQPTNEHFENLLALQWSGCADDRVLWLENESRTIGSNIIPGGIYAQMRNAWVFEIALDHSIRKKRILHEYGCFPLEVLAENTKKVAKRLGGQRLKEALAFLENADLPGWVDVMLAYYDDTYDHSNKERIKERNITIQLPDDRMDEQAILLTSLVSKMSVDAG